MALSPLSVHPYPASRNYSLFNRDQPWPWSWTRSCWSRCCCRMRREWGGGSCSSCGGQRKRDSLEKGDPVCLVKQASGARGNQTDARTLWTRYLRTFLPSCCTIRSLRILTTRGSNSSSNVYQAKHVRRLCWRGETGRGASTGEIWDKGKITLQMDGSKKENSANICI